jgi:hypothetical protein
MDEPVPVMRPEMTDPEIGVLQECFSKATSLVEFGSGGSTLLAVSSKSLRRIWSVESDPGWISRLQARPEVVAAVKDERLQLQHVDIGPTGDHGAPSDGASQAQWPAYHENVWNDPKTTRADLVLIDGRFRVACAMAALANCQAHTILLFHDFWNRTHYHPVLAFTDWLGSCDSLAILRRKATLDAPKFDAVRQAYRLQPD